MTPPCFSFLQPAVLTQEDYVSRAGKAWTREGAGIQRAEPRDTPHVRDDPPENSRPPRVSAELEAQAPFPLLQLKGLNIPRAALSLCRGHSQKSPMHVEKLGSLDLHP